MSTEIELATTPIADVRIELGRREIGVAQHLLDAPEIGPAFEQVGGERVSEEMRVNTLRL